MRNDNRPYEKLKTHLGSAAETLEALRRGEVDVVVGPDGPRLVRLKALIEENERLAEEWQTTFNALRDAICILDRDMRILRCNAAAARLLGCEPQALIGKRCCEKLHGVTGLSAECLFLRAQRSRQREGAECQWGERWFEVSLDPILDDKGNLIGAVHIFSDISERKRAEAEMRQRHGEFLAMLEGLDEAVYVADPATYEMVYANPVIERWFGPFAGRKCYAYLQGREQPCAFCTNHKIFGEYRGRSYIWEFQNQLNQRWYRCIDRAIPWPDGRTLRFELAVDITERKQAEERLQRRLACERLVSQISAWAVGAEDLERFQSDCLKLLGEGLDVSRVYIFEHREATDTMDNTFEWTAPGVTPQKDKLQGVPASAVPWWVATLRGGGSICYADITTIPDAGARAMLQTQDIRAILVVPLFVEQRYYGFLGFDECRWRREWAEEDVALLRMVAEIIADTIERVRTKRALQASEERYRRVSELISDYAYAFEVKPDNTLVREWVTESFERITGYTPEEVTARGGWPSLIHPEDLPIARERSRRLLAGESDVSEFRIVCKDGAVRWLRDHAQPVWDATRQRVIRIYGAAEDITARKEAEAERARLQEQFRQAQKLESIGRLAGGVAHDFNNALNVILGCGEMLQAELREGDPLRQWAADIVEAAKRAAGLTRQLLAFSRRQVLQPQVVEINGLVRGVEKMLRRLIGEDIAFELALAEDNPRTVVDPGQMEQVLMNLAVNARDAMPQGGKLRIATRTELLDKAQAAQLGELTPGRYIVLAVTDTGCGMTPEVKSRIFEPFFTTKEPGQGTGLGLATVYGIVRQSGGAIVVDSEPGRGSTFRIYLPWAEAKPTPVQQRGPEVAEGGRGERLLVVEDDQTLRDFLGAVLPRKGYNVRMAANAGEALLLVEEEGWIPDLVVTDVVMPHMNSKHMVERLRRTCPDLKALYMSGYTDKAIVHQGILETGVPFLHKPFTIDDLLKKVRAVLTPPL